MNIPKIRTFISEELKKVDAPLQIVIRNIVFGQDLKINWNEVEGIIKKEYPEIK